jgi:membrane protein implicated in regulation of membrane protease activity
VDAWLVWLILAVALAGAEAVSLDLVLIMFAGGALVGSASALIGLPMVLQIVLAVAGTLALLLVVRPVAKRHLTAASTPTGTEALIGCDAIVLSRVDATGGRIRLNGSEWSARALNEKQVIEVGTSVQVIEISGATALVWDHKQ